MPPLHASAHPLPAVPVPPRAPSSCNSSLVSTALIVMGIACLILSINAVQPLFFIVAAAGCLALSLLCGRVSSAPNAGSNSPPSSRSDELSSNDGSSESPPSPSPLASQRSLRGAGSAHDPAFSHRSDDSSPESTPSPSPLDREMSLRGADSAHDPALSFSPGSIPVPRRQTPIPPKILIPKDAAAKSSESVLIQHPVAPSSPEQVGQASLASLLNLPPSSASPLNPERVTPISVSSNPAEYSSSPSHARGNSSAMSAENSRNISPKLQANHAAPSASAPGVEEEERKEPVQKEPVQPAQADDSVPAPLNALTPAALGKALTVTVYDAQPRLNQKGNSTEADAGHLQPPSADVRDLLAPINFPPLEDTNASTQGGSTPTPPRVPAPAEFPPAGSYGAAVEKGLNRTSPAPVASSGQHSRAASPQPSTSRPGSRAGSRPSVSYAAAASPRNRLGASAETVSARSDQGAPGLVHPRPRKLLGDLEKD